MEITIHVCQWIFEVFAALNGSDVYGIFPSIPCIGSSYKSAQPRQSPPTRLHGHVVPHASADNRSRFYARIFQKLPLYIWIGLLAIRFQVPHSRVTSLPATDPPGPASHSMLRLRKLL